MSIRGIDTLARLVPHVMATPGIAMQLVHCHLALIAVAVCRDPIGARQKPSGECRLAPRWNLLNGRVPFIRAADPLGQGIAD
ncbi:MAG: hypothetical protein GX771_06840 [Halomonadaceae bacterium]|nr:hypothetical protein [Halomonadaceae bacterium]